MRNSYFPYHERLTLQNFTAFSHEALEFIPGINVFVGENGTGKTHALKALYAWQMARHLSEKNADANYANVFAETYGVKSVSELQRSKNRVAAVSGKFGESAWEINLQNGISTDNGVRPETKRPVFIPAIEMMAHARNMNGILRDYADFDRTCFDFLAMVTAQRLSPDESRMSDVASLSSRTPDDATAPLRSLIPGEVEWNQDEQRFYLHENEKRLPFPLVAEGVRKVSGLSRLIELNWLPPGGTLFWDEPEVNLNPKWMDEVIETLAILAGQGVQIFLATHSYVILKQIELTLRTMRAPNEERISARFFGLRRERGVSKAMWADNFAALEPNPILDQYDQMLVEDWRLQDKENSGGR